MKTYNYKCLNCDKAFEVKATIQQKEEAKSEKFKCPKCNSKNIEHKFSFANFFKNIFKNDFKSGNCCSGKDGKCE